MPGRRLGPFRMLTNSEDVGCRKRSRPLVLGRAGLRSRPRSGTPHEPAPRKVSGSSVSLVGAARTSGSSQAFVNLPRAIYESASFCPPVLLDRAREARGSVRRLLLVAPRTGEPVAFAGRIRPRFLALAAFTELRLAVRGKPACDGYPQNMACFLRRTYRGAAGKLQAGVRSCIHHRGGSTLSTICEAKMVPVRAPA